MATPSYQEEGKARADAGSGGGLVVWHQAGLIWYFWVVFVCFVLLNMRQSQWGRDGTNLSLKKVENISKVFSEGKRISRSERHNEIASKREHPGCLMISSRQWYQPACLRDFPEAVSRCPVQGQIVSRAEFIQIRVCQAYATKGGYMSLECFQETGWHDGPQNPTRILGKFMEEESMNREKAGRCESY